MTLAQANEACLRLTRRAARNFYYGIRLLPRAKRAALCAVYSWSRLCDDAVDEASGEEARRRLDDARGRLERALGDGYADDPDPVVHALGDAVRRFRLPAASFHAVLRGVETDLEGSCFDTFAQLRLYCERVAGAVGHLCLAIFGCSDPRGPDLAMDMGIALQLTNILRDLREDVHLGRVYLPRDELEAAGYSPEDLRALRATPAFERLMTQQVARAREYFRRAEGLFPLVAADARLCLMVLHAIYRELLECIDSGGSDVLRRRLSLSPARKVQLVGRLLLRPRGA